MNRRRRRKRWITTKVTSTTVEMEKINYISVFFPISIIWSHVCVNIHPNEPNTWMTHKKVKLNDKFYFSTKMKLQKKILINKENHEQHLYIHHEIIIFFFHHHQMRLERKFKVFIHLINIKDNFVFVVHVS